MKENESTQLLVVREMQQLGYTVLATAKDYDSDRDYGSELLLCQDELGHRRSMMIYVFYDGLILFRSMETTEVPVTLGANFPKGLQAFREWFGGFAGRPYHISLWRIKYTDQNKVHISIDLPFHGFEREVFLDLYTKFHDEIDSGLREIERWKISKKE